MVSLNFVAYKEKNPSPNKETRSPNPLHQNQQNNPGKNHGNAYAMQQLVPSGRVLVIVLRHVVRKAWQAHLLAVGDHSAGMKLYTENGSLARGGHTY
jgi:hypothetical protein